MIKLLEVREFETITCNEHYKKDKAFKYLPENTFNDLENFILDFQSSEDNEVIDFLKVGLRKNVGKVIQAKNYVGLIQMKNGFQVQILPKIKFDSEDIDNTAVKKIFLKMLRSMKDFPSKVFSSANLKMDRMNLYEIFINMYIQEIRNLVKQGIKSTYQPVEDNLNYYKGKLKVQDHIKQNRIHKERFYLSFDEFGVNRPENRLIKATLQKLNKLSNSSENIKEIRQLLSYFEMVETSVNYDNDFAKVSIDRNTKYYETSIKWSKVFLMNKSFTTFSGNTSARALLFPMEKVFEAYVARNMKSVLGEIGWSVTAQDKGYYLFDEPRQFSLRPDIVIERPDGTKIIMDTKWKSLVDNPLINFRISQADMYQMYAYAMKYATDDYIPEVWLLYPINEEMINHINIFFRSEDGVLVKVYFVDVAHIEDSLEKLKILLKSETKFS